MATNFPATYKKLEQRFQRNGSLNTYGGMVTGTILGTGALLLAASFACMSQYNL